VHQLSGYSAHADCDDLVAWVSAMAETPGRIKRVHGDPEAQKALAGRLVDIGYVV
ncbi:MBL fold metallo-hydrolase, partial [bacterium]|nr:MBL fold metallo-hydrolase [bacterium]